MIKREIWIDINHEGMLKKAILTTSIFKLKIFQKNIIDYVSFDGDVKLLFDYKIKPNTKIYSSYEYIA